VFQAKVDDLLRSGHDHTNTAEASPGYFVIPSCTTNPSGTCQITYGVSDVSGLYNITASSGLPSSHVSDHLQLTVSFPGLELLTESFIGGEKAFRLVGATTDHKVNHYGTSDLRQSVKAIGEDYFVTENATLGINDMSLVWGGLFDIDHNWAFPHRLHQTGRSVDISHSTQGRSNTLNQKTLRMLAEAWGFHQVPESNNNIHYELNRDKPPIF
jgi:hypothetical protein